MPAAKQSKKIPEVAKTKAYYEKYADIWSSQKTNSFHHETQFKKFIHRLPEKASVLDIGCASGIHVPLFLGIGRHLRYTGVDIARSFIKIASRRYPQLTFLEGDITKKETLPKKKYDGFFAGAVLMHVPLTYWDTMFENIVRITKPKAIGYLSLPTERPSEATKVDNRFFTLMTEAEQVAYIKSMGWKILHKGTLNGSSKNGIWKWYIVQLP